MMRCVFFFLLLFCCRHAVAQTKRVDSLRHQINTARTTGEKKTAALKVLTCWRALSNDTLHHYASMLRSLSMGDRQAALWADVYDVYYFASTAHIDKALQLSSNGIAAARHIGDTELELYFHYLRAFSKVKQSDHKNAVNYFFETLRLAEQFHNTTFQVKALNGIGWAYFEMGQSTEALQWINKAIALAKQTKAGALLGVIYLNKSACCGMENHIDSAAYYEQLAYQYAGMHDDLQTMANALAIRTNILAYYERYDDALQTIKHAVAIRKQINDPFYVVSDMVILADCYSWVHQWKQGIAVAEEAIAIARKNNLYVKLPLLYSALANNYRKSGNYRMLAEVLQHCVSLKDTIYQKAKAEELAELQTRYETEKKEAAIRLLEKENEVKDIRHRNQLYAISAIVVFFVITGLFFYGYMRARQKRRLAEQRAGLESKRLQEVIQTQEAERKRISAELHDGVGPVLSAIKLNLGQISHGVADTARYDKAMQLIDESYKELRNISHQLMPAILLKKGLISALDEMARNINSAGILTMLVDSDDPSRRYSNSLEINVYRIVQELVNNMMKYAAATETQVQVSHEPGALHLMIEDNGAGFDPALLQQSTGNGWNNIVSRLSIINGTIEIDSQPGKKGTVVFLNVPLG